ncbi:MAG TPA: DUF4386 domain-containing protein [Gemmatimonadaceae bacterium]|nr:DUF4386 domain-containing protein [Gemmatimonadaceae bacterium]
MERRDARWAGIAFLVYIVLTMTSTTMFGNVLGSGDIAQQLGDLTRMMSQARVTVVLDLLQVVCALVLAVTLFRLTKAVDATVAMLAMMFRVGEGVLGASALRGKLGLIWLASSGGHAAPQIDVNSMATYFLHEPDLRLAAFSFIIGGFLFAYLLLRGRLVPAVIAWIGVVTQGAQMVCVPLWIAGFIGAAPVNGLWMLILAYEIPVGVWLMVRGVRPPVTAPVTAPQLEVPA